jgi:hypothetical protein
MNRKIGAAVAIAAAALGAVAISAPAYAGNGNHTPEPGEVMVFQDTNFAGNNWDFPNTVQTYPTTVNTTIAVPTDAQFGTGTTAKPIDNNTSSIANYDSHTVRAYTGAGKTGSFLTLLPYNTVGGGDSWAYSSLGSFDDTFSSHAVWP